VDGAGDGSMDVFVMRRGSKRVRGGESEIKAVDEGDLSLSSTSSHVLAERARTVFFHLELECRDTFYLRFRQGAVAADYLRQG